MPHRRAGAPSRAHRPGALVDRAELVGARPPTWTRRLHLVLQPSDAEMLVLHGTPALSGACRVSVRPDLQAALDHTSTPCIAAETAMDPLNPGMHGRAGCSDLPGPCASCRTDPAASRPTLHRPTTAPPASTTVAEPPGPAAPVRDAAEEAASLYSANR